MSRNRGYTDCAFCPYPDTLEACEPIRPITKEEAGVYYDEYEGMGVANSECPWCGGKFLLWFTPAKGQAYGHMRAQCDENTGKPLPFDSSFRRAFNDEPVPEDLPTVETLKVVRSDGKDLTIWRRAESWLWKTYKEESS